TDGAVDLYSLRRLVEWQIDQGINFLVPCGSTGETATLSVEERVQVASLVVELAAGRVPVMAGASHNSTSEAVNEARRMAATDPTWLLVACPAYNRPTPEGLLRHFQVVADASSVPICLYNVPGRTAVNLKPDTVLRLAEHGNIIGIKESSGDLAQVQHLLLGRPEGFAVLSGEDWMTLAIMAAGGDGLVSVASNEIPAEMTALVAAAGAGRLEEARGILFGVLPLLEANFLETNPAPVKAALAAMGRITDGLRLPLVPLSSGKRPALHAALRAAGVSLRPELP
ncbi:MAG TPA: 4-hydroxy-tetrahydrodipicolinate synthase, partial [Gemmatimonadales bacterium]|nr:4-hydroxy-tetrahydrodipicolinate synthase [Gemmatimonadales bacterium]